MYKLLLLVMLMLVPVAAWGVADNCDCAESHTDVGCETTIGDVTYTSHIDATAVSITLDGTYTCGQYANGDYWILGKGSPRGVGVTGTSPAESQDSGGQWRSGWDVNPEFPGDNRIDQRDRMGGVGRPGIPGGDALTTLPRTYPTGYGPVSFVKAYGNTRDPAREGDWNGPCTNWSCVLFLGVWTFVDAIPDSDGDGFTADEFRPAIMGISQEKPGPFRIDAGFETRAQAFPGLDRTSVSGEEDWSFADARWGYRWPLFMVSQRSQLNIYYSLIPWHSVVSRKLLSLDRWYGQDRMGANLSYAMHFLLDDFSFPGGTGIVRPATRNDDEQALINYVQSGIDAYGEALTGQLFCADADPNGTTPRRSPISTDLRCYGEGFGGITQGPKPRALFAAHLIDDTQLKAWVAGTADMDVIKAGNAQYPGPRVVSHFTSDAEIFWGDDEISYYGVNYTQLCHPDASGQGRQPGRIGDSQCKCAGSAYASRSSNQMPYVYILVRSLGLEQLWNQDAYLDYASRWRNGVRGPQMDDSNPEVAGIYCPPPVEDHSIDPDTHKSGTPFRSIAFRVAFGESMWDVFKNTTPTTPAINLNPTYDTLSGDCDAGYTVDVVANITVDTAQCDVPAAENANYYLRCPDKLGATTWSETHLDLNSITHDFTEDCAVTTANASYGIDVKASCPAVGTYEDVVHLNTTCDAATVAPEVLGLQLINCSGTNGSTSSWLADLTEGFDIDQSIYGTTYSVCIDDVSSGTGSLRWYYGFGGATPTYKWQEVNAPYCINGEYGTVDGQPGGTPACAVAAGGGATLQAIGNHTITVVPFSDGVFNTTEGTHYTINFTVSDGTTAGESCDATPPTGWELP